MNKKWFPWRTLKVFRLIVLMSLIISSSGLTYPGAANAQHGNPSIKKHHRDAGVGLCKRERDLLSGDDSTVSSTGR